jgi:hypothetical protein
LAGLESVDIGNGDLTPEWGVDVAIKGAKVNYGPWTDRQRCVSALSRRSSVLRFSHSAGLMRVFTPPTFFDQQMTPRLVAGDQRQHTSLKIFVEFVDAAQVQVPTRQSSQVRSSPSIPVNLIWHPGLGSLLSRACERARYRRPPARVWLARTRRGRELDAPIRSAHG